jgi:hypothetical protein
MAGTALIGFVWSSVETVSARREIAQQAAQERCKGATDSDCQHLAVELRAAIAAEVAADYASQQLWVNIGGLLGLGATVIYAAAAWRESRRSANAAHATLRHAEDVTERQLRPYVYFTTPDDPPPLTPDGAAVVLLKNYGQTPARKIRLRRGYSFHSRPLGGVSVTLEEESEDIADLGPGAELNFRIQMSSVPPARFSEISSADRVVLLIRYLVTYEWMPGKTDTHDVTMVVSKQVVATGHLSLLGEHERRKKPS